MTKKIEDFVVEFRASIASTSANLERRPIQLALRNAQGLTKQMRKLQSQGPDMTEYIDAVVAVEDHLESLMRPKQDLRPLIKKGEALLELDDLIEADLLQQVKDLVAEARKKHRSPGRRDMPPPLPTPIAGECTDCGERVVGLRGGVIRWARVVNAVKKHENDVHRTSLSNETELKNLRKEFVGGADRAVAGRYRFFTV